MAGGLVALLDDVATIARAAAASADDIAAAAGKASAKAAGVVVDDAAVTPQFVKGVSPKRELPIIWRITKGSLVNKIIIILPIALLLSQFLPWALTPILMLGGTYLCFEGMAKVWEKIEHRIAPTETDEELMEAATNRTPQDEDSLVKSAIFTDLILSAEIMVISLNEVAHEPLLNRGLILIAVALLITFAVYGVVGFLVKIDDIGLYLQGKDKPATSKFSSALVKAMPVVLTTIGIVGTFAMLWVGGHIMVVGLDELGWHLPAELVHGLEHLVSGGFLTWLANTTGSLIFGAIWGAIIVAIVRLVRRLRGKDTDDSKGAADAKGAKTADETVKQA